MFRILSQLSLAALILASVPSEAQSNSNKKLIQQINSNSYFVQTFSFRPTIGEAKNILIRQASNPRARIDLIKLISAEINLRNYASQPTSEVLAKVLTAKSSPELINEDIKIALETIRIMDSTPIVEGRNLVLSAIKIVFLEAAKNVNLMSMSTITTIFEATRGPIPAVGIEVKLSLLKHISERRKLTPQELLTIAHHIQHNMRNENIYLEDHIGCDTDIETCNKIANYNSSFIEKAYELNQNFTINYCIYTIKNYAVGFAQGNWTLVREKEVLLQSMKDYSDKINSMSTACMEIAKENLGQADIKSLHTQIVKDTYQELSKRVRKMPLRKEVINTTTNGIKNYLAVLDGQNIDWKQGSILMKAQRMSADERVFAMKNLRILMMYFEAQ